MDSQLVDVVMDSRFVFLENFLERNMLKMVAGHLLLLLPFLQSLPPFVFFAFIIGKHPKSVESANFSKPIKKWPFLLKMTPFPCQNPIFAGPRSKLGITLKIAKKFIFAII